MKTKLISLLCFLSLLGSVLVLPAAGAEMPDPSTLYKKKDVNAEWEEKDATVVDLSSLNGPFEITGDGEYVLRGQTSFPVVVNAAEEDDVRLILDGASIITASGPAVRENAADKLIVTLADGSVNVLTSQSILEENGEKYSAALYAKDDLSINGTGALTVESAAGHGIQSKADLIVAGGTLQVTAGKDGLRGKNSVTLLGGDMTVVSGGDGVTTTRDDKPDKGWIVMIDGTLRVTSGGGAGEGITLDTALGALSPDGQGGFGAGWKSREKEPASDMPSQKGIKAQTSLTVAGGTLDLNCADDALHAASIAVAGGALTLRTGDDAVHADSDLLISGGTLNVPVCGEGLEGVHVTISGGTLVLVSADDGVSVSNSAVSVEGDDGSQLTLSGGTLSVTSGKDSLDCGGNIEISGGTVGLWSARDAMEGPIDCGGTARQSGGMLIIATLSGSPTVSTPFDGEPAAAVTLDQAAEAGSSITLLTPEKDGEPGRELASFTPFGSFASVFVSSGSLRKDEPCVMKVNETEVYRAP